MDIWDELADNYEEKVLSLTKVPQRRKQILSHIKSGNILNLGTGPTTYLNRDLINKGNSVVAVDLSKKMIDSAAKLFTNPHLEYILADSNNLPFQDDSFDSVISINSILPSRRKEVDSIIQEVYRVLKNEGKFVAILPSYDNVLDVSKKFNINFKRDDGLLKVWDSGQWQCFHNTKTIQDMITDNGFENYDIKKVFLKTKEDIRQIKEIYGLDTSKHFFHEYFLVSEK